MVNGLIKLARARDSKIAWGKLTGLPLKSVQIAQLTACLKLTLIITCEAHALCISRKIKIHMKFSKILHISRAELPSTERNAHDPPIH